jgi:hypothetical protein
MSLGRPSKVSPWSKSKPDILRNMYIEILRRQPLNRYLLAIFCYYIGLIRSKKVINISCNGKKGSSAVCVVCSKLNFVV